MRAYRKVITAIVILMMAVALSSCSGEVAGSSLWELAVAAGMPADKADGFFERPQNFDITVPQAGEIRFSFECVKDQLKRSFAWKRLLKWLMNWIRLAEFLTRSLQSGLRHLSE